MIGNFEEKLQLYWQVISFSIARKESERKRLEMNLHWFVWNTNRDRFKLYKDIRVETGRDHIVLSALQDWCLRQNLIGFVC